MSGNVADGRDAEGWLINRMEIRHTCIQTVLHLSHIHVRWQHLRIYQQHSISYDPKFCY